MQQPGQMKAIGHRRRIPRKSPVMTDNGQLASSQVVDSGGGGRSAAREQTLAQRRSRIPLPLIDQVTNQTDQTEEISAEPQTSSSRTDSDNQDTSQTINDKNEGASKQPALIHTDNVNTSSRILYVYSGAPRPFKTTNAQQVMSPSNDLEQSISTSGLGSSAERRLGILSAMGSDLSAQEELVRESNEMAASLPAQPVIQVPRLLVLNLEVGSSTATLTWSLALFPSNPEQIPKGLSSKFVRSKRDTRRLQVKPKVTKMTLVEDRAEKEGAANESASSLDYDVREDPSSGEMEEEAGEEDASSASGSSQATVADLRTKSTTRQATDAMIEDLFRLGGEEQSQSNHTATNSQQQETTAFASISGNTLDMPVGRRLQLSRVQTLPDVVNRRPPARQGTVSSTTTRVQDTQTPSDSALPSTTLSPTESATSTSTPTPTRAETQELPVFGTAQRSRPSRRPSFQGRRRRPSDQATAPSSLLPTDQLSETLPGSATTPSITTTTTTLAPRRASTIRDDSPPVTRAAVRPILRISTTPAPTTSRIMPSTTTSSTTTSTSTSTTTTTTTTSTTTERPATTAATDEPPAATEVMRTKETDAESTTQLGRITITTDLPTPILGRDTQTMKETTIDALASTITEPTSAPSTKSMLFSEPINSPTVGTTWTSPPPSTKLEDSAGTATRVEATLPDATLVVSEGASSEPMTSAATLKPTRAELVTNNLRTISEPVPTSAKPVQQTAQEQVRDPSSKWLVRLRRFGSNEVDIVKIVVNNLHSAQLGERQIAFKKLEPASAYEICIESASPNQQVSDKFHILDANHFLKCQDTSDVELSNGTTTITESPNNLRRMDLSQVPLESPDRTSPKLPSTSPLVSNKQQRDTEFEQQEPSKLKSLCKEFFTLPFDSRDTINFGQLKSEESRSERVADMHRGGKQSPATGRHADGASDGNSTAMPPVSGGSPRKPKSLNNALKSHMELLEINDSGGAAGESPGNVFEVFASRGYHSPSLIPPQQKGNMAANTDSQEISGLHVGRTSERPVLHPPALGAAANQQDYLNLSVLPVVGCIFGLIFLVTLANILLSTINCRSAANRRRRARVGALARVASRRNHRENRDSRDHLGSFYSDSDNSATSRSRIVVVGKKVGRPEPFAATSAYFELPASHLGTNSRHGSQQSAGSSVQGGNRLSAAGARFPLGPSFEGDERHNADMVGLARKNYDNFIHHIYNADAPLNQIDPHQLDRNSNHPSDDGAGPLAPYGGGNRRHSHQQNHHRHHHRQRHHHHNQNQKRVSGQSRISESQSNTGLLATVSGVMEQHQQRNSPSPTESGTSSTNNRRQRIRFDKINPIYNMDGLQYASPGRSRVAPGAVSSFGHSNPALSPAQTCGSESSGSSGGHEMCSMCQVSDDPNGRSCPERECSLGSDCNDASSYCTCCLDRQTQRFQKQQQQLEKVVSRNGSLVPQPFINPPEPLPPSESPVYQTRELIMTARSDASVPIQGSILSQAGEKVLSPNDGLFAAKGSHRLSDSMDECIAEHFDETRKESLDEEKTYLAFGDTSGDFVETAYIESKAPARSEPLPADLIPPPPPPPNSQPSCNSTIVKIGPAKAAKSHQSMDETINKTDFDLRRNELASKLHLAGMVKPKI